MANLKQFYTLLFLKFAVYQSQMQKETDVYLLTGSNIEPRMYHLQQATEMITEHIGLIKKQSGIYESEPWGFDAELAFLNQVIIVKSRLSAEEILNNILQIEQSLGRKRSKTAYTSRTIDIDILYYGTEIIHSQKLIVPHPRLHKRNFTLQPLAELAGSFIHPVLKLSNWELFNRSTDKVKVWVHEDKNGI